MANCIAGCEKPAKTRGLCINCYQAARGMVNSGRVTWEKLIKDGFAKEALPRGKKYGRYTSLYENFLSTSEAKSETTIKVAQ